MSEWKKVKLEQISSFLRRGISPSYVEKEGITVINQKCIRGGTINLSVAKLTDKLKRITKEKMLKNGDILINSTGTGTLGRTALVKNIKAPMTADSHVTILRPRTELVNPKFLAYYLKMSEKHIELLGRGATNQTELSPIDLGEILDIRLPPLPTQTKIANILSTYDDLIENNQKRIAILEKMAQDIYKEWFVRFRFPEWEEVEFEKGIPKSWNQVRLKSLSTMKYGKMPKKEDIQDEGYPIFSGYRISGFHSKYLVDKPEIVVIARGVGGTGDVKLSPNKSWVTNLSIIVFNEVSKVSQLFLFYKLKNSNLRLLDSGSAQSQITIDDLGNFKILVPEFEIQENFDKITDNLRSQVTLLKKKNANLKQTRDRLLPRLLSGKLKV